MVAIGLGLVTWELLGPMQMGYRIFSAGQSRAKAANKMLL